MPAPIPPTRSHLHRVGVLASFEEITHFEILWLRLLQRLPVKNSLKVPSLQGFHSVLLILSSTPGPGLVFLSEPLGIIIYVDQNQQTRAVVWTTHLSIGRVTNQPYPTIAFHGYL